MSDSQWNGGAADGFDKRDASSQGAGGASPVGRGEGFDPDATQVVGQSSGSGGTAPGQTTNGQSGSLGGQFGAGAGYQAGHSQYGTQNPAAGTGQQGQGQHAQYGGGQYGQQGQYAQGQYGQQQHGQSQYGQPQYGQPQYGQPQYGQPQGYAPGQQGQNAYGGPQSGSGQGMPWGAQGGQSNQKAPGAAITMPALRHPDGSLDKRMVAFAASLAAQVFIIIGSLGTWASAFGISASGMSGDGKITFLLALVAIGLTIAVALGKLPKVALWGVVAASAITLIVGLVDINDYMAWGLIFVILFGFVAVGASVASVLLPGGPQSERNQGFTPQA